MRGANNTGSSKFLLNPIVRNCIVGAFSLGIAFGAGIGNGFHRATLDTNTEYVTLAEYIRLELQMPLAEVEAILGRGTEVDQTQSVTTFIWINPNGSSIKAVFEENRMIEKAQKGL